MNIIFFLIAIFQIKHFLCDYPFQTPYMLGKFKSGKDWILPLSAHAGVHFLFTLVICLAVNPKLWWLALVDFVLHFTMDRIKASPKLLGRFKALSANEFRGIMEIINMPKDNPEIDLAAKNFKKNIKSNTYFWWALGFDQFFHHLTDLLVVWFLVQ